MLAQEGGQDDRYGADPIVAKLAEVIRAVGPGGRLPSERDLAAGLGVSRTALRDRLQQVEALGVLRRTVGAGTYVQALDPSGLAVGLQLAIISSQLTLESLLSVRMALERQAAIEATRLRDPVLLGYVEKAARAIADAPDDEALAAADAEFHDALLRAANNRAISFFADALAAPLRALVLQRLAALSQTPDFREVMKYAHGDIHKALLTGRPDRAARSVDDHFAAFDRLTGSAGSSLRR